MQFNISEKKIKLIFAIIFFIISILGLIYTFNSYYKSQHQKFLDNRPQSSVDVLKELEASSKKVTITPQEQANQLKLLEKSSKPVNTSKEDRLKMLQQFSE